MMDEIRSRIGSGGMGIVYRAEEVALNRLVALKVMRPSLASGDSARRRFLREAQAAASVRSDHVVAIHRVGEDRGLPYLAMPLLRGESLEARLRRDGALPPAEVARIGREVAEGLDAAHAVGLIHRDLKPDNIWLEGERGRVVVLDFGLARPIGDDSGLTREGAIVGTPSFTAPEQADGGPLDHRCDLFSLGSVLYAMSTGVAPFRGRSDLATVRLVSERPAPPITATHPLVPEGLVRLIESLHAKDPADRPPTAAGKTTPGRCCTSPAPRTAFATGAGPPSPSPGGGSRTSSEPNLDRPAAPRGQAPGPREPQDPAAIGSNPRRGEAGRGSGRRRSTIHRSGPDSGPPCPPAELPRPAPGRDSARSAPWGRRQPAILAAGMPIA